MDIPAKEAVEEALMAFPGTFLVVSHDRYFLNKVANVTMELSGGRLTRYDGGYDYYKAKKEEREAAEEVLAPLKQETRGRKDTKREQSSQKGAETEKEKRAAASGIGEEKRQELLQRAEAELAMAEAELKLLEHEMNDPELQKNPEESQRIAEAYAEKEAEIERRYEKWGALAEGL